MLEVAGLVAGYGGSRVLAGLDLTVAAGEVVGLLGRNGMGKSTLMRALIGLLPHAAGTVRWRGRPLGRLKPFEIARLGIAYVPQGREIFADLSVAQNLSLGVLGHGKWQPDFAVAVLQRFPVLAERMPGLEGVTSSYLGLAAALLLPALFANLLRRFLFYGRGLRGAYFGIVMLAVAVVAERLAANWGYIGGLNRLMNVPPFNLGGFGVAWELWDPVPVYYLVFVFALVVYLGLGVLIASPYGTALRAIGANEDRAAALGYDTAAYKLSAFTVSAAIAGLAGALFVTQFAFVSPPLIGFALSTEVLIWVALGGRRILLAAFLGAIVVRTAEGQLADLLGPYWLLALGGLFVLCVVLLPRGLLGEPLHRLAKIGLAKD